jgi:uncharacterized protein (TIGR03546 family)
MIIRKVGKLLRGKATPFQLMTACALGSAVGFVPGFEHGPGLTVVLGLLLVVLNANLFVATAAGLLAKGLSLLLMPVSFVVGRALLDGPLQGLFEALINAPVTALFGLEYYATTGGLVIGLLLGVGLGVALVRLLGAFRRRMARLEAGSPRYVELSRRWWARALVFTVAGRGHGRKTYEQLLQRRVGNPIRPVGAALAGLAVVLLAVAYQFAAEPIVTAFLQHSLERANGATVDLESARLDLATGRLVVTGLALADPNDLASDLLRARRLEADVSAADILRKRVAVDRLVLVDASTGEPRRSPGRHVGRPPKPAERRDVSVPDGRRLEHYLEQADRWKRRLAQIRRWLEPLTGGDVEAADSETLGQRLARQVRERGYAGVAARHLVTGAPTFAVYELVADGVRTPHLEGETLAIRGENLSTHPHLLGRPVRLSVRSSGGSIDAGARFKEAAGAGANAVDLHLSGLSGDALGRQMATGAAAPPVRGGEIAVDGSGTWAGGAGGWIDLPLSVTVRDSTIALPGAKPTKVDRLVLAIGVRGPLDDPRVIIDDRALADALAAAGASELAQRVRKELGGSLDEPLKKGLDDLLGGVRKPPPKKPDGG